MQVAIEEFKQLIREHKALLRAHGRVQARCSALIQGQAREIDALNAQLMRARAALVIRDTRLAWATEDLRSLRHAVADLAGGLLPVAAPMLALADLDSGPSGPRWPEPETALADVDGLEAAPPVDALEMSLVAADLVICQTGCLSHGAYWRVQDHCRRTGKPCVLVSQPEALRIVQIHRAGLDEGAEPVLVPLVARDAGTVDQPG